MLQALVPLSTAGLAVLGAVHTGRGAVAGLIILAAAALILLWSDVRLLLVGLNELSGRAGRAVLLGLYPIGSMATCIVAIGGLFVIGPEPFGAVVLAAVAGGAALRLLVGVVAVRLTMNRMPASLRDPLREALAFH